MNRRRQRVERFVGADVRSGLLAADVLLARGQRQHEAAAPRGVGGLARQAARHLPHEFFARGDHAHIRPAIARRDAKRLAFHGHDVGFRRRPDDAERNGFGDAS